MDTAIKTAFGKYGQATSDKEILRYYQMREQALSDYNSGMARQLEKGIAQGLAQGLAKGITQGIAKGMAQKDLQVILNSREIGIPVTKTASLLGISEDEVLKILNEH